MKTTRYETVKYILDRLPPENRRMCTAKGSCACRGCASANGIRKHELELYLQNKLIVDENKS